MPLETFSGPAVDRLLIQARHTLGPDAEVLAVRTVRHPNGASSYEVVAADAASARQERRLMNSGKTAHPLLKLTPSAGDLARARQRGKKGGPAIIALVGPTGVGKTTTIAKLANHPEIFGGRKVGLLCLDTYRVGAVEQIKTYAEISRLPLEVIYEGAELAPAMKRLADCDLILVDTPGRGPRAQQDIAMVQQWLSKIAPWETHLVLPAGLHPEYTRRALLAYGPLGVTHLLATKLDEYPEDWTVFDVAAAGHMPMRWVSDGQEVPRDVRSATPKLLPAIAGLRSNSSTEKAGAA